MIIINIFSSLYYTIKCQECNYFGRLLHNGEKNFLYLARTLLNYGYLTYIIDQNYLY